LLQRTKLGSVSERDNGRVSFGNEKYLHDGVQIVAEHRADFLASELETAIALEEDSSSLRTRVLCSQRSSLTRPNGVTDTAPKNLADCRDAGGEFGFPDAEVRRAGLGHDDVIFLQEFADLGPYPGLRDDLGGVLVLSYFVADGCDGADADLADVDLLSDFAQETTHHDSGIFGVLDSSAHAVEIDSVELGSLV
jgi:hypothetical protein